ncbi:MAG: DUF4407 domain-containing protein [Chitinophagales bacterium]|jgi:hypothetical protein|nr:DUF4407 domain-containing protein [Chitinophagales bacterium]
MIWNPIHKFLVYCSGANFSILQRSPSDINKQVGIGGVVLFTGILASLSSGYALFTIFETLWAAFFFGLIWGLMIFNLDRYIVSSMRKSGSFWLQMLMALPRIALAVVLGIVISKPLELKIFEKEINKQLNVIINRNKTELQNQVKTRYSNKNASFISERDSILKQMARLQANYESATLDLEKEIVGTTSETTTGKVGYGSNAKRKEALKTLAKQELQDFSTVNKQRLDSLQKIIDTENLQLETELEENSIVEEKYNGMAARMQALHELGKLYPIIGIASTFLMLLFIFLETSPVLVKLIAPKGPYDLILELHENQYKWKNKEEIASKDIIGKAKIDMLSQEVSEIVKKKNKP